MHFSVSVFTCKRVTKSENWISSYMLIRFLLLRVKARRPVVSIFLFCKELELAWKMTDTIKCTQIRRKLCVYSVCSNVGSFHTKCVKKSLGLTDVLYTIDRYLQNIQVKCVRFSS